MTTKFRWGIIGTGIIAGKFAAGVDALEGQEVIAVGSRTQAAADRFADQYDIRRRHATYADLAADTNVDAVYIATPHSLHMENTLLALRNGKHVLCEKPFAINAAQAHAMVSEARERGFFLMEAMWTRFLPIVAELRKLVADGAIGAVRMIHADFGFRTAFNPEHRLFDPALGGGALLDVGVYPVSLASMLLGRPDRIVSLGEIGATGIDEQTGILLGYPSGELAVLSTAVTTETPQEATILGEMGYIRLHTPWWTGHTLTLVRKGEAPKEIHRPYIGNGYSHEAMEVAACVQAGKTESAVMPLDESLSIMEILDTVRSQLGMKYPME